MVLIPVFASYAREMERSVLMDRSVSYRTSDSDGGGSGNRDGRASVPHLTRGRMALARRGVAEGVMAPTGDVLRLSVHGGGRSRKEKGQPNVHHPVRHALIPRTQSLPHGAAVQVTKRCQTGRGEFGKNHGLWFEMDIVNLTTFGRSGVV